MLKISSRQDLIEALHEVAELEHMLLVQYLFAAFSMKRSQEEGISLVQLNKVQEWEYTLLQIAREEMKHLGAVCQILAAIGGKPWFSRPNFPQQAEKYYPLVSSFTLARFSKDTMFRFVCFEMPADPNLPELDEFKSYASEKRQFTIGQRLHQTVGELYMRISDAFDDFSTDEQSRLFVHLNSQKMQDVWSSQVGLRVIQNKQDAQTIIREIITEGEGALVTDVNSHYAKFLSIWNELSNLNFDPSRKVAENPFVTSHHDSSSSIPVNLIKNEKTAKVSMLFNEIYQFMLLLLHSYFADVRQTNDKRKFLKNAIGQIMSSLIRPMGEILTQMPLTNNSEEGLAGPSFEVSSSVDCMNVYIDPWDTFGEVLGAISKKAKDAQQCHSRLPSVYQNIQWICKNFSSIN